MSYLCSPTRYSFVVCHEASERQRATVAMRRSASLSETGAMSHRTLAIKYTYKYCRGTSPAGHRLSVLCRAQPAKAAGNGNDGSRRLEGAH